MKRLHLPLSFTLASGLVGLLAACQVTTTTTSSGLPEQDASVTPMGDAGDTLVNGLPPDPGGTLPATALNNLKPGASFSAPLTAGGTVRVTLLGLIDPTTNQPIAYKANESVFLAEDGVLKSIRVTQGGKDNKLPFDLTFVVDNSGSMGEEADGVAAKIVEFVNLVTASGADLRVAIVGQDGYVTGALNFTDAAGVSAYLNRTGVTGTRRTVGFEGPDGPALQASSQAQQADGGAAGGENAIPGVHFAEQHLSFRKGSQRIFINFTDEPTQPGSNVALATKTLCARWKPENGTIHTVWSGYQSLAADAGVTWTENENENPADLSACTPGGVVKEIKADATDLDLTTLPLTDALRNSALVEFNSKDVAATHNVSIVIKNGTTADGKTDFANVKY